MITCAAGSGVSHPRRSPPLRLSSWRLRRRSGRPEQRGILQRRHEPVRRLDQDRRRPDHRHPRRKSPQEMTSALVAAGKDRKLTLLPDGGKANYTLRGYLVATERRQGLEDLLYLGHQRRPGRARRAGVRRRGDRRTPGQRSLERCRQRGDPQHRRQDHLATRREPVARRRLGERGRSASDSPPLPRPPRRPHRRRSRLASAKALAWWWRRWRALLATASGR